MNIRDIAKKAKVSVATVSRYLDLEKRPLIKPSTQKKLEKIIRAHGYIPNRSAQSLSRQSTNTIGMVTPFSTDVVRSPYFEGLIAGIIEGIRPLKYDLKWIMIRSEETKNIDYEQLLQEHAVDGLIFLVWRQLPKLIKAVGSKPSIPAVLINDYEKSIKSSIIYCESKSGVSELIHKLYEKGYRRFGMIRGPEKVSLDATDRFEAFKASLKSLKLPFYKSFMYRSDKFNEEFAYHLMESIIRRTERPEVIFCANDDLAHGAMKMLDDNHIRVPQDIAIAGFDDSPHNEWTRPKLTSVRQPTEDMGRAAVEVLAKLISGKSKKPIQMKFKPKVILREST